MSRRGFAALACGGFYTLMSALIGSDALRVLGFGFLALPVGAWLWIHLLPPRLHVQRTLSSTTAAVGSTVAVTLEMKTSSGRRAPVVLIEDAVPSRVGASARVSLEGVAGVGGAGREVTYALTPSMRGGYKIGPATVQVFDPFLMARTTQVVAGTDTLIVTPAVEPLRGQPGAGQQRAHGTNTSRRARGASEEFASIRTYQRGDDLRRIHWPSVAHGRGELMLRQDEARQSSGTALFLETREASLGRSGEEGFERAVSAAASLATHFAQGSAVDLVTSTRMPVSLSPRDLLLTLASVEHAPTAVLGVDRLPSRRAATVIAVLAPASAEDVQRLIRAGASASSRIAALVLPPASTMAGARAGERLASTVHGLRAAGWLVLELDPATSLAQRWNTTLRPHATSA